MAVSSLMSLGSQAMNANYAALQVTGNNIANANTAGYSRQSAQMQTAEIEATPVGFFGRGVNVATVTRLHDQFLTREAAATRSAAAADEALSKQLQQLERVFQTGEEGLGYAIGQMFNSFADVASKPQDISSRLVALARTDELGARFRTAHEQLAAMQTGVNQELKTSVTAVNSLTKQIAGVNQQIAQLAGSGHSPNDLLDLRDSMLSKLSELVQINTVNAGDGTVGVFLSGGQNLVLGTRTIELTTVADSFDPAKLQIGVRQAGGDRELAANLLTGGSISGLVSFQNRDLVDARNQLGQLAAAVTDQLNRQQGLGLDLNGQAGGMLFRVGVPQVLPAQRNTGGASISLAIADSSQVRASSYELARESTGDYSLRRLSDNHLFSPPELPALTPAVLAAGFRVDGITVQLSDPLSAPAIGDRFLLQPVANAARDMALALTDPRGLAAASPVSAAVAPANTGTLTVDQLKVLAPMAAPIADVMLRFDRDPATQATTYAYSIDGGASYSTPARTLQADVPIVFPEGSTSPLSLWSLSLRGAPAVGDTLRVSATPMPSSNNGNANAFLGLRDVGMVGAQVDNQSLNVYSNASSFSDAYASMLTDVGVRVQSAKAVARQSEAVATSSRTLAANTSGVNLDEEAAAMIQFQQSYQAAAKVLQVAQALFDTLLQATSR